MFEKGNNPRERVASYDPARAVLESISGAGLLATLGFPVAFYLRGSRVQPVKVDKKNVIENHVREEYGSSYSGIDRVDDGNGSRSVYDATLKDGSCVEIMMNRRGTKVLRSKVIENQIY